MRVGNLGTAALVSLLWLVAWAIKDARGGSPRVVTRTDTVEVAPAQLLDSLAALERRADGLMARIRGLERRDPSLVIRADTVVLPPDTVLLPVLRVTAAGRLSVPVLLRADSINYRPEIRAGYETADCDDGWSWTPDGLVCDRARLGHLWLGGGVTMTRAMTSLWHGGAIGEPYGEAGMWWRPSYRSGWAIRLTIGTDRRLRLGVRAGWRLW